LVLLLP